VTRHASRVSSVKPLVGMSYSASSVLTGSSSPLMWGMQVKCWRSSAVETSVDFAVTSMLCIERRLY